MCQDRAERYVVPMPKQIMSALIRSRLFRPEPVAITVAVLSRRISFVLYCWAYPFVETDKASEAITSIADATRLRGDFRTDCGASTKPTANHGNANAQRAKRSRCHGLLSVWYSLRNRFESPPEAW